MNNRRGKNKELICACMHLMEPYERMISNKLWNVLEELSNEGIGKCVKVERQVGYFFQKKE